MSLQKTHTGQSQTCPVCGVCLLCDPHTCPVVPPPHVCEACSVCKCCLDCDPDGHGGCESPEVDCVFCIDGVPLHASKAYHIHEGGDEHYLQGHVSTCGRAQG